MVAEFCGGMFTASPALVDVDAVYFVGTNREFGQCLDHMVTL